MSVYDNDRVLNIITVEYKSSHFLNERVNSIRALVRRPLNFITIINSDESDTIYAIELGKNESQEVYKLGNVGYSAGIQFGASVAARRGLCDILVINPDCEITSFSAVIFNRLKGGVMYFLDSNNQGVRQINLLTSKTSEYSKYRKIFYTSYYDGPAFIIKDYSENLRIASGNFMYFEELSWQSSFEQELLYDIAVKHQIGGSETLEVRKSIKASQIRGYLRFLRRKNILLLLFGVPVSLIRWLVK
ncbi:hypothetical protein N9Y85_05085 [Paracoccaceae bacterium]|nr:hypothetical protein [Paracoccaceae bacterium]